MSSSVFTGTPRIVSERGEGHTTVYWLRTEQGGYERIKQRFFPMIASARFGRDQLRSLYEEAFDNSAQVRCVAGLKPGLYQDHRETFLNPDFVPLIKPQTAAEPPEEFRAIFNQCVSLQDENNVANKDRIQKLRKQLRELYCHVRKVKEVRVTRKHHPWTVLGKLFNPETFPCDDHRCLFEGPSSYVWTSQPYGIEAAKILGFARLHGLVVTVSPEWSWYYPGKSVLIEWTKDPERRIDN